MASPALGGAAGNYFNSNQTNHGTVVFTLNGIINKESSNTDLCVYVCVCVLERERERKRREKYLYLLCD